MVCPVQLVDERLIGLAFNQPINQFGRSGKPHISIGLADFLAHIGLYIIGRYCLNGSIHEMLNYQITNWQISNKFCTESYPNMFQSQSSEYCFFVLGGKIKFYNI